MDGNDACCCRYFYEYDRPVSGIGHFLHTYQGDGSPLPSFEGEPKRIAITAKNAMEFSDLLWRSLNADNKVSLFVRYVDLATGRAEEIISNKQY